MNLLRVVTATFLFLVTFRFFMMQEWIWFAGALLLCAANGIIAIFADGDEW